MPSDPENISPKPDKKPNQLKDLSPKDDTPDSADKIKGGGVGPCFRSGKTK